MKNKLIALLGFALYSVLRLTWRIRVIEPTSLQVALNDGRPLVFAHWHGDELGILHLLKRYKAAAMISTSKDGEIMDFVVRLFGARTSRGSSTRGGVSALKGILRLARDGWRPSVAVDGPKGPLHKVKPGVFEIAKVLDSEIFPIAAVADRKHVFERAWNKTFLPLPFAKVVIVWGEPIAKIGRQADSRDPELARRLEEALANAGQQARNLIATP
ncbi:MAG TPA: lysophospholipid acyltransferase family protein [Bdellovibrionales bacterium]|nr:lysophospholipid acyltransferase family protein [Bdellovibrionales bacterium]